MEGMYTYLNVIEHVHVLNIMHLSTYHFCFYEIKIFKLMEENCSYTGSSVVLRDYCLHYYKAGLLCHLKLRTLQARLLQGNCFCFVTKSL